MFAILMIAYAYATFEGFISKYDTMFFKKKKKWLTYFRKSHILIIQANL